MTVLLTGFQPFDGQSVNPSWQAVVRVQQGWTGSEPVEVLELPVDFVTAGPLLTEAVARLRPRLVVAVGQAGGRPDVTVERVAINVDDARIPDAQGYAPVDVPVVADGPAAYFSTLPVKAAVAAMVAAGVPASVSQTAGTYVCNHVFYRLMHELAGAGAAGEGSGAGDDSRTGDDSGAGGRTPRGGFVHVPFTPEQAAGTRHPSMSLDVVVAGLTALVRTSLDVAEDVRVTGGATH